MLKVEIKSKALIDKAQKEFSSEISDSEDSFELAELSDDSSSHKSQTAIKSQVNNKTTRASRNVKMVQDGYQSRTQQPEIRVIKETSEDPDILRESFDVDEINQRKVEMMKEYTAKKVTALPKKTSEFNY